MNDKETLAKELEQIPDSLLPKVLEFIKSLKEQHQIEQLETSLLSESTLAQDWLSSEEDEAWQNL